MNTNVDEWFKSSVYKILWEEKLKKEKFNILLNLDKSIANFLMEVEFVEMRVFSFPEVWGIYYKFMHKGNEYVFKTKPELLGDVVYCNGEIITEFMDITHSKASIVLELLHSFIMEELSNRGIEI